MKLKLSLFALLLLLTATSVKAQLGADVIKNFNFGKVAVTGWWGTVSLNVNNGNLSRTATGSVELKSSVFHPAEIYLYGVQKGNPGPLYLPAKAAVIPGKSTTSHFGLLHLYII